ncbi:flagellar hook-associated protein FlgL [Erwinia aphidicola]|nr:flagellar hook-associated protein FlgL [Erwinia aphidicola]
MRLSTQHMFNQSVKTMSARINETYSVYSRLSAGKTLMAASDDPQGAADAVKYQNALAKMELYSNTRSTVMGNMQQADSVLQSMSQLVSKELNSKILAAMNGTASKEDLAALGKEISGITSSLTDLANSRDGSGRYLFSGFKTDIAPYDDLGNYMGGDTAQRQTIDEGTEIQTGHLGKDIFNSGEPDDLFKNLQAAAALTADPIDPDAVKLALGDANRAVDVGISSIGKVQSELGTHMQQIERLNMQGDADRDAMMEKLTNVLGADIGTMARLSGDAKMSQYAMESSMLVFQAMQKMTLFRS